MILYQEDWLRYPGAIADFQTTNTSFIRFCNLLKKQGVKNCLFPLALFDKRLVGVDPFDPKLPAELCTAVIIECKRNPWYWLREVARLPATGTDGIRVQANRSIIAMWWCLLNCFSTYAIQPRQTGKSVGADLFHVYNVMVYGYKTQGLLITKDRPLVVKNTERLKAIRGMLPSYMWIKTRKDKDIEDYINYAQEMNTLNLIPAQNDPQSAINAARGYTIERLHVDEIAFVKYNWVMLPAVSSAMDAAINNAKAAGMLYGRLYTTTAGDLSTKQGKYAYDLFVSGCPWSEGLYDKQNREEALNFINFQTGLPVPLVSMQFSHRMLGISDEEFYARIMSAPSTDEDINKDYFLIWGKGGKDNIIPKAILADMDKSIRMAKYNEMTSTGYVIRWYIDQEEIPQYMATHKCILGVDTSEQIGRDSTALVLINVTDLSVVATVSIRQGSILTSAKWLAEFMSKYENVTLIIEKKSSAQTFIDTILLTFTHAGINPFKRIFNRIIDNKLLKPDLYMLLQRNRMPSKDDIEQCRQYFGFNTSEKTRTHLYSKVLDEAAKQSRHVMRDQFLVNQLAQLKVDDSGRVDHSADGHDDSCIAWLLANWLLRYGKNIDFYGIDSRRAMINVTQDGKQLCEDDFVELERIEKLKQEADELVEEFSKTSHAALRMRISQRLNVINKQLDGYGIETRTVDSFVRKEEDDKRIDVRKRRFGMMTSVVRSPYGSR